MASNKITREKPVVKTVRIRVQEMDGNKPLKTQSITLYGADVDAVFKQLDSWVDGTLLADK